LQNTLYIIFQSQNQGAGGNDCIQHASSTLTGIKGESWGWNSILYLGSRERPPPVPPAPPNMLPVMTTTKKIKKM